MDKSKAMRLEIMKLLMSDPKALDDIIRRLQEGRTIFYGVLDDDETNHDTTEKNK